MMTGGKTQVAAGLPTGSIVATDDNAYIKRHMDAPYPWHVTGWDHFANEQIDDLIASGVAYVLRVGVPLAPVREEGTS